MHKIPIDVPITGSKLLIGRPSEPTRSEKRDMHLLSWYRDRASVLEVSDPVRPLIVICVVDAPETSVTEGISDTVMQLSTEGPSELPLACA
jgi:hypothetical protein